MSDEQLAEKARTSEEAFAILYERFLPQIFGYVTKRIADRSEAEDITANIFLRVVEHLKTFNPQKSRFKTWLYTITTNMLIDHFRSSGRRKYEDLEKAEAVPSQNPGPQEEAAGSQNRQKVQHVISLLPERHQRVILLKYFSDLSIPEMAQALGVTANNAGVMLHRALAAFQLTYERYE